MNKPLQVLIIAACCLAGINSKAQSVSFKTIENDPRDIKNLTIHLDPFYADAWLTNITLGFGARAEYHLGRLASFSFDFRTPYPGTDTQARVHVDGDLPYPSTEGEKRGLARFIYTEAGGQFHIFDWTKAKDLKVVLSSHQGSKTTTTTYIMVPGTKRKVFAARGGFSTIRSAFAIDDIKSKVKAYQGTDTIHFGSYVDTKGGSSVYNGYSNINMLVFHAGLSIKSITNLLVSTDSYGMKGNRQYTDFYFDLLFAPVISVTDVMTNNKTIWTMDPGPLKHTGWRVGYSFKNSVKSFMSYKTELGFRPGFEGGNFFLNLTWGWTIPLSLKASAPKKTE